MSKDEISIPPILKIERGVTAHIGEYLKAEDFTQVVILFGNGLISMFGDTVFKSFDDHFPGLLGSGLLGGLVFLAGSD